ncbi:unnamed protein product [Diamesa hyperborea]
MVAETVTLTVDDFGTVENHITKKQDAVKRFTWTNGNKVSVQILSYGAMIHSVKVPGKDGTIADVALGFDTIDGYVKGGNPAYMGSMMGRIANRVANGEFELNGEKFTIAKNFLGKHGIHGGLIGFCKFNWDSYIDGTTLYLTHVNPDGFEGYPGTVMVTAECKLCDNNSFSMILRAVTSKPTPINLSNHSYFNLAGHDKGYTELYKHKCTINANATLAIDAEQIPTGQLNSVSGTAYDFRMPVALGDAIAKTPGNGFDNNFCITQGSKKTLSFVARVVHPESGREMEVYSNEPSVLFYTSNNLPDPFIGKGGANYKKHGAFCLETQKYADAVHHPNFPSIILNPGQQYEQETIYKFGVYSGTD